MSVSVSGLIPPKALFDLDVSVSCLFGPKICKAFIASVSGFIPENSQFKLSVSVSGQVWTPGNLI